MTPFHPGLCSVPGDVMKNYRTPAHAKTHPITDSFYIKNGIFHIPRRSDDLMWTWLGKGLGGSFSLWSIWTSQVVFCWAPLPWLRVTWRSDHRHTPLGCTVGLCWAPVYTRELHSLHSCPMLPSLAMLLLFLGKTMRCKAASAGLDGGGIRLAHKVLRRATISYCLFLYIDWWDL